MVQDFFSKKKIKVIINIILARYFIFLVFLLMILIISLSYKFIISPLNVSIAQEIRVKNEDKQIQKKYFSETLKNIKKYRRDYLALDENDKKRIDIMIPNGNDASQLFTDIEAFIIKNGFILNSIEIVSSDDVKTKRSKKTEEDQEKSVKSERLKKIEIKLDISNANYKRFKKLLDAFENNLRP